MRKIAIDVLRGNSACKSGVEKSERICLEQKFTEFDLHTIIQYASPEEALWCLRLWPEYDKEWRGLAISFAKKIEHLLTDPRSKNALIVAEKFVNSEATIEELNVARVAAWAAVNDVVGAMGRAVARVVARVIAGVATGDGGVVAWETAEDVVRVMDRATTRSEQSDMLKAVINQKLGGE